ncbi:MAG: hypothetical protein A2W80_01825 [Candidatus Riflebacteria bacterium GWC2_50_8]|nr:MAG: hypothetical protein A2W80_01825 [Candidatus Riflebacteria bacterium GWC2_50_8]
MTRKILSIALLFVALSFVPAFAVELEPIPAGANVVVFVNNHSGLPLGDLLKSAPIPPMAREKLDEFFAATAFNPLKDITRAQLMVKKGATKREDNAVVVLSGSFNKDKITGFIKKAIGEGIAEEKVGDLTLFQSKDGKGGLCFIDSTKVALGTLAAVRVYIDARTGSDLSKDYDELKKLLSDKAYAAVMVGGPDFLSGEMDKNRERRKARQEKMPRGPNPVGKWLEEYLAEGVEPQGVFAQLLDSKIEARFFYSRGESKNNVIQASVEVIDPKLTIEKMFGEFLKILPELPAPEPKKKDPEKAPGPNKW